MARKQYPVARDGEWIQPVRRGYNLACCDCGLVHKINFHVLKYAGGKRTKIFFQASRNNRATANIRRYRHPKRRK